MHVLIGTQARGSLDARHVRGVHEVSLWLGFDLWIENVRTLDATSPYVAQCVGHVVIGGNRKSGREVVRWILSLRSDLSERSVGESGV